MFARFGHGHSVAFGALLTLALERHALLVLVLVYGAGVVTGRFWRELGRAVSSVRDRAVAPRPPTRRKTSW